MQAHPVNGYSSFDHLVLSICSGDGRNVRMTMFTVYVDDSGTDSVARVTTGAVCVSSVPRWKAFERKWKKICAKNGVKHFHMTEFAACRPSKPCRDCRNGKKSTVDHPWQLWSERKRDQVLIALANTVNKYVDFGFGVAIKKQDYNDHVLNAQLKQIVGRDVGNKHHTFTIQLCGGAIREWRAATRMTAPMKYVFDTTDDLVQRSEIADLFIRAATDPNRLIEQGFTPTGYSFESRKDTVQLLAADMLAWVATKVTVADVFEAKMFDKLSHEARTVAQIFLNGKKLNIAKITRQQLEKWARQETEYRLKIATAGKK